VARVTGAIATRRRNLAHLVNRYGLLTRELGDKDHELTRLVRASNAVLGSLASEDGSISAFVSKLPGTLRQTQTTLAKVDTLGRRLGPALESLRPAFRRLAGANRQLLPLALEGEPILRRQLRPFARTARPVLADLGEGARDLGAAAPDLTTVLAKANRLVNILAFNPGGAQGLTGDPAADRARQEGYLYWLAWVGQNGSSVFSTADAQGVWRRLSACDSDPAALAQIITPGLITLPPATQAQVLAALAASGFGGVCP
jgi:ABC-type transporter Mla subunit MlaD